MTNNTVLDELIADLESLYTKHEILAKSNVQNEESYLNLSRELKIEHDTIAELTLKIKNFEAQNAEQVTKIHDLCHKVETLGLSNAELNDALTHLNINYQRVLAENESSQKISDEYRELVKSNTELVSLHNNTTTQVSDLSSQNAFFQSRIAELEQNLKSKLIREQELTDNLKQSEEKYTQTLSLNAMLSADKEFLSKTNKLLSLERNDLQGEASQNSELIKENESLMAQIALLQESLNTSKNDNARLLEIHSEEASRHNVTQIMLQEAELKNYRLVAKLANTELTLLNNEAKINELLEVKNEIQRQLIDANISLTNKEAEAEELVKLHVAKLDLLAAQLLETSTTKDALEVQILELDNKLIAQQKEYNSLNNQYQRSLQSAQAQQLKENFMASDIAEKNFLQEKVNLLRSELDAKTQEILAYQELDEEKAQTIKLLEESIVSLNAEITALNNAPIAEVVNTNIQNELDNILNESLNHKKELETYENQIILLNDDLIIKAQELKRLNALLEENENRYNNLLSEKERQISNLQLAKIENITAIPKIQKVETPLNIDHLGIHDKLIFLEEHLDEKNSELNRLYAKIDDLSSLLSQNEENPSIFNSNVSAELNAALKLASTTEDENKNLNRQITFLNAELDKVKNTSAKLDSTLKNTNFTEIFENLNQNEKQALKSKIENWIGEIENCINILNNE